MPDNGSRILAINPGSTSTKIAVYDCDQPAFTANIKHSDAELAPFSSRPLLDQLDFREQKINEALISQHIEVNSLQAVVGRGGLLKPVTSGTFTVNDRMLDDLRTAARGQHASNLGAFLAHRIAHRAGCRAFIVDPVSVDEWMLVPRLSGLKDLDRECLSHALNTKAVAKRFARETKRKYEWLRLVVAHLGSGISISAHEGGLMIDVTNSREEGAFSTERAGSLPVMKLVDLCFSGRYTRDELERMIFREGGIFSYLGTRDLEEALRRANVGDEYARLVLDALLYQIVKEIGAMAAILGGRVDAILVTGGMAHSVQLMEELKARIAWIAPMHLYPGEDELRALAEGALRVLRGEEEPQQYV